MALQLFRIGIIGTLFIRCLVSIFLLFMKCFKNLNSVVAIIVLLQQYATICNNMPVISPDPQLKIIKHPPANAIFSQLQPLFLPCSANYTGPYDYDNNDDGDIMDDLQEEEKFNKMKKTHFTDLKPDDLNEIMIAKTVDSDDDEDDDDDDGDDSGTGSFFKRDTYGRENKFIYKWLRNGLPLTHRSDFDIFPNGTLKLTKQKSAAGIYQCVADGSKLGIGAVISTSCVVEKAVFGRYPAEKNISAETDSFVVIDCPFYSVPAANITWRYANNNTIDFNQNNRMFQLLNGSLLITKVKESDNQTYKCTAQNTYYHTRPVRTFSTLLDVVNVIESHVKSRISSLWVPENRSIEIRTGDTLKLICVAYSEEVRWSFRSRNGNQSFNMNDTSNVLVFRNVSYAANDGFYNCSTATDFQIYNVTVSVPPTIVQPLNSKLPRIGEFSTLNCMATGNPKPRITWYKNGAPLVFDYIVTYNEPIVKINTYEEEHKGIYQCVASNSAGEVHSLALYTWMNNRITKGPEKVKCYPLNKSTMLIDYQNINVWNNIVYYTSRNHSSSIIWQSKFEHDVKRFDGKLIVPISSVDLFDPFVFYVRGMLRIGHEQRVGGNQNSLYDMSRLSKGVKCALQGLEIYSILHQTGIFIWWPKLQVANLTHLNIQFRYNDTSNPTKFSDQIIGTKEKLKEMERWDDIQPKLIKISAITNVYPEFQGTRDRRFVTNNSKQFASSSVSVPYVNDELKKLDTTKRSEKSEGITEVRVPGQVTGILIPNTQFIDVRVLVPVMDTDGELYQDNGYVEWKTISKPSTISQFQIVEIESRSITLSAPNKNITCIEACIMREFDKSCHLIRMQNSKFRIKNLVPDASNRILLYDCIQNYSQLGEINARTKQDVPGPITNYTIFNKNGWKLKWSPPNHIAGLQSNRYYEIEWTINNELHSKNVSFDKNYFEFPFEQDEKFNITIRAVSDAHGIPIHINSENISQDREKINNTQRRDPKLGILIGVMLSILCIVVTCCIIVRYRTCSKHDSGHNVTRNTTSPIPTQSATCNLDLHEMQNLIAKAETLAPNGLVRHSGNGNSAVSERIMLNSSTPKKPRNDEDFSCVIKAKDDDDDERNSNPAAAQLSFPASVETNQSNGATCVDGNTAVLPQKVHSNAKNLFPSTPPNGNLKAPSNPQYSTDSLINTSLFDRSQQQLLSTTIDSNTSNINLSTLNENDDTLELNGDSSYSQQPLHNWNFRRPIIGPNG